MKILTVIILSFLANNLLYNSALAETADSSQITFSEQSILYVNINTADLEMLADLLIGVGEKKAQAIIDHREQVGFFINPDDLLAVKGIGPSILEKNRSAILTELPLESES